MISITLLLKEVVAKFPGIRCRKCRRTLRVDREFIFAESDENDFFLGVMCQRCADKRAQEIGAQI